MHERKGSRAVILLVDDDPGDQELARRALDDDEMRTELHVVSDGEEAMDYLLRRGKYKSPETSPRPQLMLLDLNMPRMDGRQVMKEVRANADLRRIPIIVLTTSKAEEDVIRSYDSGCNSFISKPVSVEDLVRILRDWKRYWLELCTVPTH